MNVYIVTANAGDRNDYSDFYIPDGHRPPFSWWTMAEYLFSGYAEEVSIMGVYSTRGQAENPSVSSIANTSTNSKSSNAS